MEFDSIFWIALQSSMILGLIHGVNPCGHSWLVLAPFVVGQKKGGKVAFLTTAFILGTALACLVLGATLGAISQAIPHSLEYWVEIGTAGILILLGLILIIKPHLLHHHDDHDHHHNEEPNHHEHDGHHHACPTHACPTLLTKNHKATGTALFGVGFVNMIIPCPTLAIMYTYALDSGSYIHSSAIFGIYAIGTAIAIAAVIFGIFKVTTLLKKLCQDWVEGAIMRTAGVMTVSFGLYSLFLYI